MQRFLVPTGESVQDVIPMITHDLRQPVTAIKGYSQLALRQSDLTPRVNHLVSTIVDEINQLAALLEDLALVSRIERGMVAVHAAPVNLGGLVGHTVDALTSSRIDGELTTTVATVLIEANCDSALTQRALANVIRYSLKFSQQNHPMHVDLVDTERGPAILISADGVDGANLPSLGREPTPTNPSIEPDDPRVVQDLSLFLATRLIELQGGEVWGEDRVRERAGFLVLLPPVAPNGAAQSHPNGGR